MLGEQCLSNGTYLRDTDIQNGGGGYIHCVLPNEILNGGQWLRPDGQPVNCTDGAEKEEATTELELSDAELMDPFFCYDDSPNANISLYLEDNDYFKPTAAIEGGINTGIETEYKCCLPTDCSDPNTNIMTINVFGKL